MSSGQDRLILIACVIVESVWFYVLISVFSLLLLQGSSALTWIVAVVVMGGSFVVARTTLMIIMPLWMQYVIQMVTGVVIVYLMLGTYILPSGPGLNLGWLGAVMSDVASTDDRVRAMIAALFAAFIWWRGGRIASIEFPTEHLSTTFRVGLIALSLGAVVDIFNSANLNIFPLMFTFFAAGLTGLSIGHILPTSSSRNVQQRWTRIIGGVVGAIILVGLVFSILHKSAIDFIATPLGVLLNALVTLVIYVVVLPIAYIISFILIGLFRLFSSLIGEPPEQPEQDIGLNEGFFDELREQATSSEPSIWGDVIEWTIVAILAIAALWLMAQGFRRIMRWRRVDENAEREPVMDDVDPGLDMARLLFNLLPERFRRRKGEAGLRLPDDEQDIVDVFRIYFGMLNIAETQGFRRAGNQTPSEYRSTLDRVFPRRLVQMATDAFNRACYGRRPASRAQIDEMRETLEQVDSSK